jgi:murein tripeptide amidase MpaA
MVNPDGVHRGNFRTDQNGINLNRVYGNPSSMDHPTVYAIKRLFVHYAKKSGT